MTPGRLLLAGACGLAALYAAGLVYEMDFARPVCCGLGWPNTDPVASARWQAAADPAGRNVAVQRGSALMQLAAEPADASAWMRLAWADRLQHGALTKAGASALDMSYEVRPYSQPVWRTTFALQNWSRLTPEGRQGAMREIAIARTERKHWPLVRAQIRRSVSDPEGRAAMTLLDVN